MARSASKAPSGPRERPRSTRGPCTASWQGRRRGAVPGQPRRSCAPRPCAAPLRRGGGSMRQRGGRSSSGRPST
eukprot:524135-Alexandrium_andersonii.AAC.1